MRILKIGSLNKLSEAHGKAEPLLVRALWMGNAPESIPLRKSSSGRGHSVLLSHLGHSVFILKTTRITGP